MLESQDKYHFCIIPPMLTPKGEKSLSLPKEQRIPNYKTLQPLLDDIDWDFDAGAMSPLGDWPIESREGFGRLAGVRIPLVRKLCESGKYNAIALFGGGDPGFVEAREIGARFNIPVTSCAFAQMHLAVTLGNKFSFIDLCEEHNMLLYDLVVRYHMKDRCASIRNIDFPLSNYLYDPSQSSIQMEQAKAEKGERSEAVERAVIEAVAAIEEDGAEVLVFGCSPTYWLRPFVEERLREIGWEVPVLEGYSSALVLAKMMVDLKVNVSGLTLPGDRPKKWRRKKVF
jgi:allantoin racemase